MRITRSTALLSTCLAVTFACSLGCVPGAVAADDAPIGFFYPGAPPVASQQLAKPKTWSQGGIKLQVTGMGVGRDPNGNRYMLVLMVSYDGLPGGWRLDSDNVKLVGPSGPIARASYLGSFSSGWQGGPSSAYLNFALPAKGTSVLREFSGKFDNQHDGERTAGPYAIEPLKKPTLLSGASGIATELFDWSVIDTLPISLDRTALGPDLAIQPRGSDDQGYLAIRFYVLDRSDTISTPELTVYGADGTAYKTLSQENWVYPSSPGESADTSYVGITFNPWGQKTSAVRRGKRIDGVVPGSPADKAGIRAGDVLLQVDGVPVDADPQTFPGMGEGMPPGDALDLVVLRGGTKMTFSPVLAADPRWVGMAANVSASTERLMALLPKGTRRGDGSRSDSLIERLYIVPQPVRKDFVPARLEFKVTEVVRATKSIAFSVRAIPVPPSIVKEFAKHRSTKSLVPEMPSSFDPTLTSGKVTVRNLPKPLVWKQNGTSVALASIGRGHVGYDDREPGEDDLLTVLRCDGIPSGARFRSAKATDQSGRNLNVSYVSVGLPGSSTQVSVAFRVGTERLTSLRELSGRFDDSEEEHRTSEACSLGDLAKPQVLGRSGMALLLHDYAVSLLPTTRVSLVDIEFMGGKLPLPKPDPGYGYAVFRFFGESAGEAVGLPELEVKGTDGSWGKTRMEVTNAFCLHDAGEWEPSYLGLQVSLGRNPSSGKTSVSSVDPNGPSALAGIRPGDALTRLGSRRFASTISFMNSFDKPIEPGRQLAATVLRDGRSIDLKITPTPDPLWAGMFPLRAVMDAKLRPYVKNGEQTHLCGFAYTYPVPVPLDYRPTAIRFAYDGRTTPTKTVSFVFRDVQIPADLRHPKAK